MSSAQQFETKAELGCGFCLIEFVASRCYGKHRGGQGGPFIDLSELSHTTQRLNHWLQVISKWRDWLSSARIFRV